MTPVKRFSRRLTPAQKGMLFHTLAAPGTGVSIQQVIVTLDRLTNANRVRRAWEMVVGRHDILRSHYCWDRDDAPYHETGDEPRLEWMHEDHPLLSDMDLRAKLDDYLLNDRVRDFSMDRGPLTRLALISNGGRSHCIWTFHQSILDHVAIATVLSEVVACYDHLETGSSLNLPTPPSLWPLLASYENDSREGNENFWKEELRGVEAPSKFPLLTSDDQRHSIKADKSLERKIPKSVTEALNDTKRSASFSLRDLTYGAWGILLSRYAEAGNSGDVVFGVTRDCRGGITSDSESVVGCLINTVPFRIEVDNQTLAGDYLKQIRATDLRLKAAERASLANIQTWSGASSSQPLFDTLVLFEDKPLHEALDSSRASSGCRSIEHRGQTNFPITVVTRGGKSPSIRIQWDARSLDRESVDSILNHLCQLMMELVTQLDAPIGSLNYLAEDERQWLVHGLNQTARDYPRDRCLHELFADQVERSPDRIAAQDARSQITYRELDRRANALANQLVQQGVGPDVLVGICTHRSIEMIVGLLGILKAGGAFVPLDPAFPADRIAMMLEDSDASVLVTQRGLSPSRPANGMVVIEIEAEATATDASFDPKAWTRPDSSDLAYVIFTSGSTGRPKGVQITHQSIVNFLESMRREPGMSANDRLLAVTTLSFDIAGLEIFLPLTSGATVQIVSRECAANAQQLSEAIETLRPTMMQATPATWRMLLESGWQGAPELKVLCGGEAFPRDLIAPLISRCRELWNMYGPTETTIWSSLERVTGTNDPTAIGRPIDNTQIYLLDARLQPVPVGVTGELYIGGDGLARGYLNRPELTEQQFIASPFTGGARLYRTGDLARYLPDGRIECLGRKDHQVKIRGYRIELGEIEVALSNHAEVRDCVVVDREFGPGDTRLVAYVVAVSEDPPSASELRAALRRKLPDYMIPSTFVSIERIPRTPNGKTDRNSLPSPTSRLAKDQRDDARPRTSGEQRLREIWTTELKIGSVDIDDNYFDLGANSLMLVRVHREIQNELGHHFPLVTFFQYPTIRALAEHLAGATDESKQHRVKDRAQRQRDAFKKARQRFRRSQHA